MGDFSSFLAFPGDIRNPRTLNEILKHQTRASGPWSGYFPARHPLAGLWSHLVFGHWSTFASLVSSTSTERAHICLLSPKHTLSLLVDGNIMVLFPRCSGDSEPCEALSCRQDQLGHFWGQVESEIALLHVQNLRW